jgi:hypothetical protein
MVEGETGGFAEILPRRISAIGAIDAINATFRPRRKRLCCLWRGCRRCAAWDGIHNPKVGSSSLPPATNQINKLGLPLR